MDKNGLVLFAHGARDPRWAEPFERLRSLVASNRQDEPVALAYLELMTPDLGTAVEGLIAQGCSRVVVVPIFLGQGGHVRRDLPAQVDRIRETHPGLEISCALAAGEDDAVLTALAQYCIKAAVKS